MSITAQAQLPSSLSSGLIAFYQFDGEGNDASGNGRHLVLGENTFTNGIRGQSMSIFGGNQASYGESRKLPLLIKNSFSFSLWMKPETLNRGWPEWIYLIDGNAEFMNVSLRIGVNDGSQVPESRNLGSVELINGGGGGELSSYDTANNGSIKSNVWNHIVVTVDGTNEIAIYANGLLVQKWINTPEFFFDQNNFFLGNGRGNQYPLQGQLDQVRVYNRALTSSEVAALYSYEATDVVLVKGGVLPSSSELSGQSVNSFRIGKTEITWGEFKQVREWAVANGYTDLSSIGTGGSDNHPVRLVNWYDAVKWCNAKSEKEGLKPVYYRNGQVYRQGEGPSDSPYDPNSQVIYVIDRDLIANGYRLPSDAEWEWAARGGVSSRGFIFSGSDDLNDVGWYKDNSSGAPAAFLDGRGTYPVGLKQPNELGIYDMSGNASEWVWDPLGDWRRVRGGAFHTLQELCEVGKKSADAAGYRDSDTCVKGGFRVASNTPLDFDTDEDGVNDYREGKDGTNPNDPSLFNPLSKGLIGFYPLDGNVNDESGNGFDGVVVGNLQPTHGLNGPHSAYFFDGSDASIDVADKVLLIGQDYTISTWFRTAAPSKRPQVIFNTIPHTGIGIAHLSYVSAAAGRFTFGIGDSVSYWDYLGGGADQLVEPDDSWFHRVLVKEGTSYKMYVNGALHSQIDIPASASYTAAVGYRFGSSGVHSPFGNETINGALDDVRIYNRALTNRDVENLFYAEAFSDMQKQFLVSTPWVMGHYSQANYNDNRTNGQTDVRTNPSAFNLFTQAQFDSNRTAGQNDVISDPMVYGLYNSDSIMDLRMGGLMIQKQGNNATVVFQTQTTTDLATQPFTNTGTPITNTLPMAGDKGFLRIQAR